MNNTPPTATERQAARAYVATAVIAKALTVAAIGAGVLAWGTWGPLAGVTAWGLAYWAAKACKAPMPDELAQRFR